MTVFYECVTAYDCYCGYSCCMPCLETTSSNYNPTTFCCNDFAAAIPKDASMNLSCSADTTYDCLLPWQFCLVTFGSLLIVACIAYCCFQCYVSYEQKRNRSAARQNGGNGSVNMDSHINNAFSVNTDGMVFTTTNINDGVNVLPSYLEANDMPSEKVDPFKEGMVSTTRTVLSRNESLPPSYGENVGHFEDVAL